MKAIIFDVFGTLIKVEKGNSARTVISHIAASGVDVDEKSFLTEWRSYYAARTAPECNFMTEREIFTARIKMFYERYGVSRNAQEDCDAMLSAAFSRTAYDDVIATLNELKKSCSIILGSNTDNDVLNAVLKTNMIPADKIYTSENLRCYKPNPRFFRMILKDCALTADEAMFVGDNPRDDISGPKALGIKTVLIDRSGNGELHGQDHTIASMHELISIAQMY